MWWSTLGFAVFLLQTADPSADGLKALEEKRWEAAALSFSKAIEADPRNYAHLFNLAFAQSMMGRAPEAIATYRKALELKPGLYEAELNLGILLLESNRAAEAVALLEDAVKQKPKEFRPVWYLAESLLGSGEASRAAPLFQTALELKPASKDAQLGLARSLARSGKLTEAEAQFRKAAESSPDVMLEMAGARESAGHREEALAIYTTFPDNPSAREQAGEILLESGKPAEAIPHLEAAVRLSPAPANRFALASAYNLTRDFVKAEPLFAAALQAEPGNLSLRASYARVLRAQRKYGPAAQEFAKITQAKPDSAEAWSDLAGMLILLENDQQALAALDRVRALGAETAAHFYFRAILLDKHRMYEPALASYEKFLAMSGNKNPDEEFKARQRVRIIRKELEKR